MLIAKSWPYLIRIFSAVLLLQLSLPAALSFDNFDNFDNFVNAVPLGGGSQTFTYDNSTATAEPLEPAHAGAIPSHSIWFSWTAPGHSWVKISTAFSTFDTVLAVYTGDSLATLTPVIANDNADESLKSSFVSFYAIPGTKYYFAVDGAGGSAGSIFFQFLEIPFQPGPPVLLSQPGDAFVVLGGAVNFNAAVAGTPPLSFQWWKDSQPIPGATNPLLSFSNVKTTNAGVYSLTVSNQLGSVRSTNARLEMIVSPIITRQPDSITNEPGSTAVFAVTAIGVPTMRFKWYKDGVPIPAYKAPSTASTLSIPKITASDTGVYTVRVFNDFGSRNSETARLSLSRDPTPTESAVRISAVHSTRNVPAGGGVSFDVALTGEQPVQIQWYHDQQPIPGATNQVYRIDETRLEDSGTYSVAAKNAFGSATNQGVQFVARSLPHPANDNFSGRKILVDGSTASESTQNATMEPLEPQPYPGQGGKSLWWTWTAPADGVVMVEARGNQLYCLIAAYHGDSIDSLQLVDRQFTSETFGGAALSLLVVAGETLQFQVDSYYGYNGTVAVNPRFFPGFAAAILPSFLTHPQGTNMAAGRDVTLSATAAGSHPLSYQWSRDGVPIAAPSQSVLILTNAQSSDSGMYRVTVANTVSTVTSDPALVQIQPEPPAIAFAEPDRTLTRGYPFRLSVRATGSSPMGYQWFRNDQPIPGATNAQYLERHIGPDSTGVYSVRVSNPMGTTNSPGVHIADVDAGVQYRWSTLAGTPGQAGLRDGLGANARFSTPSGLALDSSGTLFVADRDNQVVRLVAPNGDVTIVRDDFRTPYRFLNPIDLDLLPNGGLVVAQQQSSAIRVYEDGLTGTIGDVDWGIGAARDGTVLLVQANRVSRGLTSAGRPVLAVGFNEATDATEDPSGRVLVAESNGYTIKRIELDGTVTVLAGTPGQRGYSEGIGSAVRLVHPNSVSLDAHGNIFFADEFADAIRRLAPDGTVTTVGGWVEGTEDGPGSEARFSNPRRVLAAPDGVLYVVDTANNTIRKGVPMTVPAPIPQLRMNVAAGQLELSWPADSPASVMENAVSLATPLNWQPAADAPQLEAGRWIHRLPIGPSAQYFRLRKN